MDDEGDMEDFDLETDLVDLVDGGTEGVLSFRSLDADLSLRR